MKLEMKWIMITDYYYY